MSNKTVIGWLIVAVVFGAAALFLLNRGGGGGNTTGVGERLFAFSPSDVTGIEVRQADGSTDRVTREADGEWTLRIGQQQTAWPLLPENVHGLLRQMSDAKPVAKPDRGAALGEHPTSVTISVSGAGGAAGKQISIRLAERTLGGTGLIEVTPPGTGKPALAVVDDWMHRVFRPAGIREWRDRAVFAGPGASGMLTDASRIRMESAPATGQGKTLALGKMQGRWSVREPLTRGAPADAAAVQRLMGSLGDLKIADFLDSGVGSAATGLDKPVARLTIEADRVSGTAKGEMRFGGPADAQSARLYASIQMGSAPARTVLIDARILTMLTMDPGAYLTAAPASVAGPDIGMIVLARLEGGAGGANPESAGGTTGGIIYKRGANRWSRMNPDGSEMLLVEGDLKVVESLVDFLTTGGKVAGTAGGAPPAAAAGGGPVIGVVAPQNYKALARISLLSLSQSPLEDIEVGLSGSTARAASATLRTGEVYRSWPADRLPRLLAELVTSARGANGTAEVPETDINK